MDIDWNDAGEKTAAFHTLVRQLDALQGWIERRLPEEIATPPLQQRQALVQIRAQDLEPDRAKYPQAAESFRRADQRARSSDGRGVDTMITNGARTALDQAGVK